MFFQLGNNSVSLSFRNVVTLLTDLGNIKFECKDHVGYTSLQFSKNDYIKDTPYMSIRTLGLSIDGLVYLRDLIKAMERHSYYTIEGGTIRKRRCPNGSRRDKTSGRCKNKTTGEFVDSITATTKSKTRSSRKSKKEKLTRTKFSPIEYKRNFKHSLVFVLKKTPKVVERVVSLNVVTGGSVIGADHCQSNQNFEVYTIKEISNKTGKSPRSLPVGFRSNSKRQSKGKRKIKSKGKRKGKKQNMAKSI